MKPSKLVRIRSSVILLAVCAVALVGAGCSAAAGGDAPAAAAPAAEPAAGAPAASTVPAAAPPPPAPQQQFPPQDHLNKTAVARVLRLSPTTTDISPKKSPGPRHASKRRPPGCALEICTSPDWMMRTTSPGSPSSKISSPELYVRS